MLNHWGRIRLLLIYYLHIFMWEWGVYNFSIDSILLSVILYLIH